MQRQPEIQQQNDIQVSQAHKTISELLISKKSQFEQLLPSHIPLQRFLRIVFVAIVKNPKIKQCVPETILASVLKAAESGLLPNGRDGALVPFKNSQTNKLECEFLPMYQGLIDLARRSGLVKDIFPATVYENDIFEYALGFDRKLVHVPAKENHGKPIYYYAVAELENGAKTFGPGPMTPDEIENIRKRSKAPNSPAWKNDYEVMAWKTVIKRTLKFCPQSAELQRAVEIDNENYESIDFDVSTGEVYQPTGYQSETKGTAGLKQRLTEQSEPAEVDPFVAEMEAQEAREAAEKGK